MRDTRRTRRYKCVHAFTRMFDYLLTTEFLIFRILKRDPVIAPIRKKK